MTITNYALSAVATRGLNAVLNDGGFEVGSPDLLLDDVLTHLAQLGALTAEKAVLWRELEAMPALARRSMSRVIFITRQKM